MAAHVCYRLCCRQVLQQSPRSLKAVPQSASSGQAFVKTIASNLQKFHPRTQFYHAVHHNVELQTAISYSRFILWRNLWSQRKSSIAIKDSVRSQQPGLLRPFAFTVFVSGCSFVGCMIWQYEAVRKRTQEVIKGLNRHFDNMLPSSDQRIGFRAHVNAMWNSLSEGQKMVAGLIGVNFLIFLSWKAPSLHPFLMRYFASLPSNPSISMLLAAFSHYNLWHVAANMYVLWSFASISLNLFGREQWLAVYITSATLSSFTSLANKVLRGGSFAPSLGASGAIMCLLGAVCVTHPDARLSIAFIGDLYPHSFSASTALKVILLLDTTGLLMGWRVFDHAAHLGGVLFGMWYATYGHKLIWGQRETVMRWWHGIRGKPSK